MEGTEKHLVGCKKREKIEKVTGSQDDGFVGVVMKNSLNKITLMGLASWAKFRRPCGTELGRVVLTQTH